jgi:hypothetical protein
VVLLSSLAFIGFATFDRVFRSGIEALYYGERIARLRAYYFDFAPRYLGDGAWPKWWVWVDGPSRRSPYRELS